MTSDDRKLVLVVDADQRFVDTARSLLHNHRALAVRDLDEAREIVLGGRVDIVVLGPGCASEASVAAAATLHDADPTVAIVLFADVVTNRLLKAALRGGLADVIDMPLTAAAVAMILGETTSPTLPTEIEFIVDSAPPTPQVAPLEVHSAPMPATDPVAWTAPAVIDSAPVVAPQPAPTAWEQPAPVHIPVAPAVETVAPPVVQQPVIAPIPQAPPAVPQSAPVAPPVETPPIHQSPQAPVTPQPVAAPTPTVAVMPPVEEPRIEVLAPPVVPVAPAAPPSGPSHEAVSIPTTSGPAWPAPTEPAPAVHAVPPEFAPPARPVAGAPVWPDDAPAPLPPAPPVAPYPDLRPAHEPPAVTPIPARPATPPPMPIHSGENRQSPRSPSGGGRVIAVMAGKGGSGKSVVATNLAIAMGMRNDPERVAIVDADLQFGDVALMLQLDPIRTIDDVVGQLDSMSDSRLDAALLRHESGLRVLAAPLLPVRGGEIPGKSVVEVIDRLRRLYDTIIVDTGPVFDDNLVTILEHADSVVTVVDMDLPSVKNAKVALDSLRSSGFPMERITMVVNRVNSKARLDLVELERSLGLRVGGSVPSDRLVPQSVNEGIPLLALSPRSKVARSFMALAERLDPGADRRRITGH